MSSRILIVLAWIVLLLGNWALLKPAEAACEDYSFQLGQQAATYTYLYTSGGQTQEITANMNYFHGVWSTISTYAEEGPVQAGSSFRIMCTGRSVAAELSHSVSSATSPQSVTTNGAGQFCVTAVGSPSAPLTIQVDIKRVILPSNDAVGTAILGSYDINIDSRSWFTSESAIYVIQPGESLPIIKLNGKLTLTSVGSITARTTVIVTLVGCDGSLRDVDVPDDADDDEADLDPDEYIRLRKQLLRGRSPAPVWLHPATGNVSTVVPVFETFANDATELDFQLRHDSQRAAQDGPLGYGWTHSYHVRIASVNGGPPVRCQKFIYWTEGGRRNAMTPWVPNQCSYFPGSGYMRPPGRNFDVDWPEGTSEPRVFSTNGEESVFDTAGRLKRIRDKRGRTTYFLYDSSGRLATIISPHGRVVTLQYQHATDPKLITKIIDPDQKETILTYENGNLKAITNPLLQTTTYEYDNSRRITRTTVENAPTWHAVYATENIIKDKNQAVIAKVSPGSGMELPTERSAPIVPGIITYTEGCDRVWSMERDRLGRSFKKAATNAAARQVEYGGLSSGANWNRLVKKIDELGGTTQYEWTTDGYVAVQSDALNNVTRYYYEEDRFKDLVTKVLLPGASEPNKGTWEYDYDNDNGDLLAIKDPIRESPDKITTLAYETHPADQGIPNGYYVSALPGRIKKVTATDRNGHVTIYEYNLKGCMTKLTRGAGTGQGALNLVANYEYDNMGRRTKEIVDRPGEASVVTEWTYDALGRERTMTRDPGGLNLLTTRQYDVQGNLTLLTDPRGKKTKFEYDERNRIWKKIEAYGELNLTTEWQYDCRGNLGALIDPNQNPTTFLYDVQDHLTQATDAENYKTTLGRDAAGRLVRLDRFLAPGPNATSAYTVLFSYDKLARPMLQTVDPGGLNLATRAEYLPPGACTCNPATPGTDLPYKLTDPAGKVTFLAYDNLDRRTRIVRKVGDQNATPEGDTDDAVAQIQYDAEGNRTTIIGPENEQIVYEYDAADRRTRRTLYSSATGSLITQYAYDADDNLRTITSPNGNVQTFAYDLANRQVAVNDNVGIVVMYSYDAGDNVIREADGLLRTTRYEYDAVNRLTKVFDPIVETPTDLFTELAYDGVGNRTRMTDNNGVKTGYVYDKLNRLLKTIEDDSPPMATATASTMTSYAYNGLVQTAIADHDGNTTTYGYDSALRMTSTTYPSPGGQVTYAYTAAGKLSTRIDQRNITTTYTYDDLHQLAARAYSGGGFSSRSESFAFDRSGRLISGDNGYVRAEREYDRLGRLTIGRQIYEVDPVTYATTHDYTVAANDARDVLTYPGGRAATRRFDARFRLYEAASGSGVRETWAFDAADQRYSASRANGVGEEIGFDANGRMTRIERSGYYGGIDLSVFSITDYGYDPVGNRMFTRQFPFEANRSESYVHDRRNRLTVMDRGFMDFSETAVSSPLQHTTLAGKQQWTDLDRRGKAKSANILRAQDAAEIEKDFERLSEGAKVTEKGDGVLVAVHEDGTKVIMRKSRDGRKTIEIQAPDKTKTEVRYGKKERPRQEPGNSESSQNKGGESDGTPATGDKSSSSTHPKTG